MTVIWAQIQPSRILAPCARLVYVPRARMCGLVLGDVTGMNSTALVACALVHVRSDTSLGPCKNLGINI